MRVPISWLREYVNIDIPITELADRLTFSGIEVSNIESIGILNPKVVCGKIIFKSFVKNRNDVFNLKIDIGTELIETVSNAIEMHQISEGQNIAIALPGAILFTTEENEYSIKTIESSLLYNQKCDCTICSLKELGISSEIGKLYLVSNSVLPGEILANHIVRQNNWFTDEVLTLEILANISRCQSIIGVAKEVSAITRQSMSNVLSLQELTITQERNYFINNDISDLVKYFSLTRVDNIQVHDSPIYIKIRLSLCGIQPINNIVDIANYVMLEIGQPLHIYDNDKLLNNQFQIKLSDGSESFTTLSNSEINDPIKLPKDVVSIYCGDKMIALGGIIGGISTSVSDNTKSIVIESANFDLISIRKSQNRLKIYTEASSRFSRGVSYDLCIVAVNRFISLVLKECKNISISETVQAADNLSFEKSEIEFLPDSLNESLGTKFNIDEMQVLLNYVDIETNISSNTKSVIAKIPLSRQDITIENDLYEEVARLIGYDRMPTTMPMAPIPSHPMNHKLRLRESIRTAMVLSGLSEIISYSMTTPEVESNLFYNQLNINKNTDFVRLKNPVSSDKTVMRTSLIPGMLNIIAFNLKYTSSISLFEIGNTFIPEKGTIDNLLPKEPLYLSIGLSGNEETENFYNKKPRKFDIFDLKAHVEFLFEHLKITGVTIENYEEHNYLFQTGLCAVIKKNKKVYGYLGKVHPFVTTKFSLDKSNIYCAEINLDTLMDDSVRFFEFQEIDKFPSIKVDISIVLSSEINSDEIISTIRDFKIENVKDIELFDLYNGSNLDITQKSVTLRITLYDKSKTLSQNEANLIRDRIVQLLAETYGASLRQ